MESPVQNEGSRATGAAGNPRHLGWIVKAAVGLFLIVAIGAMIVPDQVRTPSAPKTSLPRQHRVARQWPDRNGGEKPARIPVSARQTDGPSEHAHSGGAADSPESDPALDEWIAGLLPVKDISKVPTENQAGAREWNSLVRRTLTELADLVSSPTTLDTDVRRYDSLQLKYARDTRAWKPRLDLSSSLQLADLNALDDLVFREAGVRIWLNHGDPIGAGVLCVEHEDWDGATYCLRQAGWKGRVLLSGVSVWRRCKQTHDALVRSMTDRYLGR